MFDFKIAETKTFSKAKSKMDNRLYHKIKNVVYPQLRKNPFYGSNIKKLKGEFEDYYRYRIGTYRLFYLIEKKEVIVLIIDLQPSKNAYRSKA